jgi:hypothetical protein
MNEGIYFNYIRYKIQYCNCKKSTSLGCPQDDAVTCVI